MPGVRRFEDLVAWQLANELCDLVYQLTEHDAAARDFEFRHQIRTASSKTAPLIAEGFIRYTSREFVRYLRMARAETGEVQSHLEKARRRAYFTPDQQARVS